MKPHAKIGCELLVEIIAGKHGPLGEDTIARAMAELYALGIKPDWWKLEPQSSAAAWAGISAAIAWPVCRGVVLLGLEAPQASLNMLSAPWLALSASRVLRLAARCLPPPPKTGSKAASMMTRPLTAWRIGSKTCAALGKLRAADRRYDDDQHNRLTMAQALTLYLSRQMTITCGKKQPIFAGVWAIFGHGNVAGLGEALYQHRPRPADLPRPQ